MPDNTQTAQSLPMLLARVYCLMIDRVASGMHAAGHDRLRAAHGFVFRQLRERGEMTVIDIARYLGITKQAALELVDDLARWGYVARRRNPRDGRSRLIGLTELGRTVEATVDGVFGELETQWQHEIGVDGLSQVRTALAAYLGTTDAEVPLRPVW